MKTPVTLALVVALFFAPITPLTSNPIDPEVIAGSVDFPEEFTDLLEITQNSDRAIIHWEGFSINHGELTRFIQPSSSAAVLNRVISGDVSNIEGTLEANGSVLLLNPNGILFGAGARVDTNGFIASTLDVPDAEFLAGGDMRFSGASQAPVVNLGEITAANGDVFLIGATVQNDGNISAPYGTVGLAAGQQILITKEGDERVFVEVGSNGAVDHSGAIRAASAELKAAGGNPKAMAVNVSGKVEATGVQRRGGRVYLSAGGGGVRVANRVQARRDDGSGGIVQATGAEVQVDATGDLDASGTTGGEVHVVGSVQAQVLGRAAAKSSDAIGGEVQVDAPIVDIGAGAQVLADGALGGGFVDARADELTIAENAQLKANASVDGGGGLVLATGHVSADIGGSLAARGRGAGNGGFVNVSGGDLMLAQTSRLDATGAEGGFVTVDGSGDVHVAGRIDARGQAGDGGFVNVRADGDVDVTATARVDASGEVGGGMITIAGGGDVSVGGELLARGKTGDGGFIHVEGDGDVDITATARLDASGEVNGGMITVDGGGDVNVDGQLLARGKTGNGGQIFVTGDGNVSVGQTAVLDASGGVDGGFINVEGGDEVSIGGRITAAGGSGQGGMISVTGENGVTIEQSALLDASGATGGSVFIDSPNGQSTVRGVVRAVGNEGAGGRVEVTGQTVGIDTTANIDASGQIGGGKVMIGGGFQGNDDAIRNAERTAVAAGATIAANSFQSGDAGEVIVWADGTTHFFGEINAQAFGVDGDGGFVEVSGKERLGFQGVVSTASLNGENGDLLLDPNILTILFGGLTGTLDTLIGTGLGTILNTDGGANESVSAGTIQSLAAAGNNINLAANNEINYSGPAGSHLNVGNSSFTAEVVSGDINFNNMDITAYGGVNLDGANINVGSIYTNPNMPGMPTGDFTFNATGNVNVNNVFAEGSNGDAMNINGQDGGAINGGLTNGNFIANNVYQNGGNGGFGGSAGNGGNFNVNSSSGMSIASVSGTLNNQGGQGGTTNSNPPIPGGNGGMSTGNTTPFAGTMVSGMGPNGIVSLPGGGDDAGVPGDVGFEDLGIIDPFNIGDPAADPEDPNAIDPNGGAVDFADFLNFGPDFAGDVENNALGGEPAGIWPNGESNPSETGSSETQAFFNENPSIFAGGDFGQGVGPLNPDGQFFLGLEEDFLDPDDAFEFAQGFNVDPDAEFGDGPGLDGVPQFGQENQGIFGGGFGAGFPFQIGGNQGQQPQQQPNPPFNNAFAILFGNLGGGNGNPFIGPVDNPDRIQGEIDDRQQQLRDLDQQADEAFRLAQAQFDAAIEAAGDGDQANFDALRQQSEDNARLAADLRNQIGGIQNEVNGLVDQLNGLGGPNPFQPVGGLFGGLGNIIGGAGQNLGGGGNQPFIGPVDDPGRIQGEIDNRQGQLQGLADRQDELRNRADAFFNAAIEAAGDGDQANFDALRQQSEDAAREAAGLDGQINQLQGEVNGLVDQLEGFGEPNGGNGLFPLAGLLDGVFGGNGGAANGGNNNGGGQPGDGVIGIDGGGNFGIGVGGRLVFPRQQDESDGPVSVVRPPSPLPGTNDQPEADDAENGDRPNVLRGAVERMIGGKGKGRKGGKGKGRKGRDDGDIEIRVEPLRQGQARFDGTTLFDLTDEGNLEALRAAFERGEDVEFGPNTPNPFTQNN